MNVQYSKTTRTANVVHSRADDLPSTHLPSAATALWRTEAGWGRETLSTMCTPPSLPPSQPHLNPQSEELSLSIWRSGQQLFGRCSSGETFSEVDEFRRRHGKWRFTYRRFSRRLRPADGKPRDVLVLGLVHVLVLRLVLGLFGLPARAMGASI